jgi:hypothetical protein
MTSAVVLSAIHESRNTIYYAPAAGPEEAKGCREAQMAGLLNTSSADILLPGYCVVQLGHD